MKKLRAVVKNELLRYFVSPLAYVYLLSFLVLNGSFAIYFGDFFNRGQANLLSMFIFQPWLYLLFIPGISMRLWAEEFRNKTVVQIVTMPISIQTLVWGKFLAAWSFCGIALFLTFPFWITVNLLGQPDNAVIFLGYGASFVLAGCMLAISQTMSALTKNQVIALVLAVLANLFFFWSGIEYILSVFRLFLPDTIIDVIASLSFISHFNTLSRGLLELRDVIFFASVILFFNFTTVLVVNFKTAGTSGWLKSTSRSYSAVAWLLLLCGFFGLNILANNLTRNIQFDATQEKIFTLTDNTRRILRTLPEPVFGKLYFSPVLEQRNAQLRNMFDTVRLLLQKYKDASNGNFDFKVYYPEFLSEEEDIALAAGIQPVPLVDINQNALFGLSLEDTLQNTAVIPFFAQEHEGALEQDITDKIYQMHQNKKSLGILTGLPIFGSSGGDGTVLGQPWQIIETLKQRFDIVNIVRPQDFERHFDVLLILFPTELTAEFIEPIKKYSQNNGNILLILDPANEASRLYSYENKKLHASDIGELADFWGIKFYDQYVVADLQNSITVDATTDYQLNPVFTQDVIQFKIKSGDMNPKHPVTRRLNEIMMASASVIMPQPEAYQSGKIKFYPLLKASPLSSLMTSKVVIDGLNPQQILQYFQPDDNQKFLAAEVRGQELGNQFDLIVVGDSDFLYDTFWATRKKLLESDYTVNTFDNANFILNALDYLSSNDDLLNLRGKKAKNRAFAGIENMRRINSLHFKQQEEKIFDKIDLAKRSLQEVWNKRHFEERENFSADEMAAIANVRTQLGVLRKELSNLRYQAFRNVQQISSAVSFINIWLIPGILFLILLGRRLFKHLRHKDMSLALQIDKRLLKLGGICLFVLALGLISVYFANRSDVDLYEGKPAFPNVTDNINTIDKIVLRANSGTLTFQKSDGLWILAENPSLPVYQERIRRLLTTIADAKFFERKTNKAENLALFQLDPIENGTSKAVQITLQNGDEIIQRFDLGTIDVDMGRGSKAAYIKFDNQFQVWKIAADFVDMGTQPQKWTYSRLWDLRFGRFYSAANNVDEENRLMLLMKNLLNTEILNVTDVPEGKPVHALKLFIEDGNYADILFYKHNGKSYAVYLFDKNNGNHHLKLFAKYLTNKAVEIDSQNMEKILEQLK